MRRVRRESVISIKVIPQVKQAWEELDERTKKFLINKFQMEVLGLKDEEVPEETKTVLRIEYDKETLKVMKELILGKSDYEELLELAKNAISFLQTLWNAQKSYGGCEVIESNEGRFLLLLQKARELGLV